MLDVKALEKTIRKEFINDEFFMEKLFLSGDLLATLESKVWFANHEWGIPDVPIKVTWSPGGFIARTNDYEIQLNAGNDYFSSVPIERYYQLFGAVAHESAHRRYTNFNKMTKFADKLSKGTLKLPKGLKKEERSTLSRLLKKAPKSFSMIAMKLHNAVEDGRIEDLFLYYDRNLRSLYEGLARLREETYFNHSPSYPEVMNEITNGMPKFMGIEQMLLTYGRFGEVQDLPEKGEIPELLHSVFPLIDDFKRQEVDEGMETFVKVLAKLSGHIEEYLLNKANEQNQGDSSEDSQPNENEGGSSGGNLDEDDPNNMNGSQDQGADGPSGSQEDGDENSSNNDSSSGGKSDALDDIDDGSVAEDVEKDLSKMKGTTDTPNLTTAGEDQYGKPQEGGKTDTGLSSSDLDRLKEEAVNEEIERRADEFIKELNGKRAGQSVDREKPNEYDIMAYKQLIKSVEPSIKKAIKLSTFNFEPTPYLAKNRYFGTRFNAGSVARGNYKNFDRIIKPPQKSGLRVVLNIDESGSMHGNNISYARQAAAIVYEYCIRMEIPIDIIGFDTTLRSYADSEYISKMDGPRLMRLEARGGTDDYTPLMVAKRKLSEHPEAKKLVIVISDGEGEYQTPELVKACIKENIVILCAAIGPDRERLEGIYGRDSYMNIEDLQSLPQIMVKKIKNMLY